MSFPHLVKAAGHVDALGAWLVRQPWHANWFVHLARKPQRTMNIVTVKDLCSACSVEYIYMLEKINCWT